MRLLYRILLAISLMVPSLGSQAAQWKASLFDGEASRAALGCSAQPSDDSWLCLAVRCDAPGRLGLYLEVTTVDVREDTFAIVIGEQRFDVTGSGDVGDAPYRFRLLGRINDIVSALKSGSSAFLDRPQYPFSAGFDTVPLSGSSRAIGDVEKECSLTASADDVAPTPGVALLPLKKGLYAREDVTCATRTNATTMSFSGDELNSQRARGRITAVNGTAPQYQVTISARDIAEDADLGVLEWTITTRSDDRFSLSEGDPTQSFRWCEALPGTTG